MIYLIAAIICSVGNALTLKFAEKKTGNRLSLLLVNYIVAVLFGLFFIARDGTAIEILPSGNELIKVVIFGLINGSLYLAAFALLQRNIQINGATISASMSHMGLLIPILLSILLFRETLSGMQAAGTLIAMSSIVVISVPERNGTEAKQTRNNRMLLIPMLICTGMADMMSKIFEAYCDHAAESVFMEITFATSLLICLEECIRQGEKVNKYDLLYGAILGVLNYMSVKFLIWALYRNQAYLIYVLYGIGVIFVINIINLVFLHEKLSRKDYLGMVLIAAAIVFLNI